MTSEELFGKHFNGLHYDDVTPERIKKYAIEFAKLTVVDVVTAIKENVTYGICQNDDGQEPYHHESNIFVDHRSIDSAYSLDDIV